MKKLFFMGAVCLSTSVFAQKIESEKDSTELKTIALDEVLVSAVRAKKNLPVTFSNIPKSDIQKRNVGQQIPILVGYLPNVVSHSEDGSGFGATYMSVRGNDTYRTNVTINGIPYNDSESQGTFWYNLSDFASSAESIQLQRGVGTSTNGAGAFGASLNILTDAISQDSYAEIANYYGSYNTHKHMIKLSTGKINDRFELSGRFSKINSDGYRDRASSDLKSYFLQGAYSYGKTLIKGMIFGGKEKTYLTWVGLDELTLNSNRKYNPAGEYTDALGNKQFYNNETDNYQQDHAQLHWVEKWGTNWTTNLAFHYTKGRGYWEQYEKKNYEKEYKLPLNERAYAIVQKALDNNFYGTTFSANYKNNEMDFIFGASGNKYEGRHFREILWAEKHLISYKNKYQDEKTLKKEGSAFAKLSWQIAPRWNIFGDIQFRHVAYDAQRYEVDEKFNFINPKAGITFSPNINNSIYFSYAKGSKEPNRSDYKDNYPLKPKAEQVNDFELGWKLTSSRIQLNTNFYYMLYKNQLVLTGKLSETGYPIRDNSGDSYRTGLEIDATISFSEKWIWQPNISYSKNKNVNFHIEKEGNVVNLGNTNISFSPEMVIGSALTFRPISKLSATLLSKYVGEQYMTNEDNEKAKLKSYFVNNLLLSYEINPKKFCKSISISLVTNNIFNNKYVAYGSFWGEATYFPQAEINYLTGLTLSF